MALPVQKLPFSKKDESWKQDTINYYERMSYSSVASNRTTNYNKKINYDLFNGRFNKADLEYVSNPLGLKDNDFPATLQHYDIISPSLNLLIGEETKRSDNFIVVSETPLDINRKQESLKKKIVEMLQQRLMGEIDPSTIDPNNPPPTPEQIIKYEKHNISDLIESQANKILKYLKKSLNTKETFKRGWKDALIAGEEIYWSGVSNDEVLFRRCNPLNTTVILDGDTEYIDDALAVIEVRMLAPASIIDEFGSDLTADQVGEIEEISKRFTSSYNLVNNNPTFSLDRTNGVVDTGLSNFSTINTTAGAFNSELIRVVRIEWKSFKKLYHLEYTDENDLPVEQIVDESFKISVFKQVYKNATVEEFWINEAWEGIKIGDRIYVNVQPKENQRRRMDNPYYCKLGYTGTIYNATNSVSVSLLDRLKPYQYLYNIISYRLELAFASDQGRIFLMDLAQIPRSEGMDIERWMYYLKAMKIAFINSHEEANKGSQTGKISHFNQFQSIDLSLSNTIQQYIQTLDYIKSQAAFISGVSPQRLGAISNRELVGNVERSVEQSSLGTEYLFDSHDECKRKVYVGLIECAKIAFRKGKKVQFVLDDMGIELLNIEESQLDNSEFNVYVTDSSKDQSVLQALKQLAQSALQADKADLSTIINSLVNDSPKDMIRAIQQGEEAKYKRMSDSQKQQLDSQEKMQQMQLQEKQADRDLEQYKTDTSNQTRIQVAEINAMRSMTGPSDVNENLIPDASEVANLALKERDISSKAFMEQSKLIHDKQKHDKELSIKEKEIKLKSDIEDKKIEAIKIQNQNQIELANKKASLDRDLMNKKMEIEKLKIKSSNNKK